jgi:hypothetical protein
MKASPKNPPDLTLDQTDEGIARTHVMPRIDRATSSKNLVKKVPKEKITRGIPQEKM